MYWLARTKSGETPSDIEGTPYSLKHVTRMDSRQYFWSVLHNEPWTYILLTYFFKCGIPGGNTFFDAAFRGGRQFLTLVLGGSQLKKKNGLKQHKNT